MLSEPQLHEITTGTQRVDLTAALLDVARGMRKFYAWTKYTATYPSRDPDGIEPFSLLTGADRLEALVAEIGGVAALRGETPEEAAFTAWLRSMLGEITFTERHEQAFFGTGGDLVLVDGRLRDDAGRTYVVFVREEVRGAE